MIFIFGAARSGTTWLAKLFDSHPDLLYLHEPDITDRGLDLLPFWFDRAPNGNEARNAKLYLERLVAQRSSRSVGTQPLFGKNYRGPVAEVMRRSLIYATKTLELGIGAAKELQIPDLTRRRSNPTVVIKSVSALGRAEALLMAGATIAPVLLIRHPCGFVNSMLRGKSLGVMEGVEGLGQLAKTRAAINLALSSAALENADEVSLLAWTWLVSNVEALAAVKRAKGSILIYDVIMEDPSRHIHKLFASLGLGWPTQTKAFLARSQQSEGDYYSIYRNSKDAAQRWRRELDVSTINRIRHIVSRDPLGSQFFQT